MTIDIPVGAFDDLITEIEDSIDVYDASDIVFDTLLFYMLPESYNRFIKFYGGD